MNRFVDRHLHPLAHYPDQLLPIENAGGALVRIKPRHHQIQAQDRDRSGRAEHQDRSEEGEK